MSTATTATTATTASMSEQDFLSLPESMQRVELLDGELILPPSPTPRHQEILLRVVMALRAWAAAHPPATVLIAPADVRFGTGRILQPDALVLLEGLANPDQTPIDQVPDLVVEVLSARRSYDRFAKRLIYLEAGVSEYWIVDPQGLHIEVWRGDEATLQTLDMRSDLLPGLALSIPSLFP